MPLVENDENLLARAYAAYYRSFRQQPGGLCDEPSSSLSDVETYQDKAYVVLRNNYRVLAVYRVRNDGMLKGLKRWPKIFGSY